MNLDEVEQQIKDGSINSDFILQKLAGVLDRLANTIVGEELDSETSDMIAETLWELSSLVKVEALRVRAREMGQDND